MTTASGPQDASLSAATFLASISAESSTSFGSSNQSRASTSAPALPISAKVSLIDAQIDALEGRIEQAVTAHAAQLRERAASTRSVERDLNQLWRSINQTSSRLVTVGPQLAPIATEYHDALAQSSKQGLLISVLSDLLAATRHLERLEKLQQQSDLSALRAELPKVSELLQPFRSRSALQTLPAVVELQTRFGRLEKSITEADAASRSAASALQAAQQPQARVSLEKSTHESKEVSDAAPALSPALKVLEAARALIVARGSDDGWKEVRIELDAPAPPPPPPTIQQPHVEASRSSIDTYPDRLLREEVAPESTSLTRNSSSSSQTNARNRHKPKLGARLIRPQDQLGSGPFNAEDDDGWGLDDDEDELVSQPTTTTATTTTHPAQAPNSSAHTKLPSHRDVAALAGASQHSSPSSSVVMQHSMSSSSSQRSAFAVQEPEQSTSNSGADAWDLEDEADAGNAEEDGWGLDEDDAPQQIPLSPKKDRDSDKAGASDAVATQASHAAYAPQTPSAASDAWGLEEDEASQPFPPSPKKASNATSREPAHHAHIATSSAASAVPNARATEEDVDADDDPWATEEPSKDIPTIAPVPTSQPGQAVLSKTNSHAEPNLHEVPASTAAVQPQPSQEPASVPVRSASLANVTSAEKTVDDEDPWETQEQPEKATVSSLEPHMQENVQPTAAIVSNSALPTAANLAITQTSTRQPAADEAHQSAISVAKPDDEIMDADDDPWAPEETSVHAAPSVPQNSLHPTQAGVDPPAQPHKVLSDDQAEVTKQTKSSTADMDMDDEEAEEDGWGFEEGSGASEVDKDEFAPMTALPKDDTLANPLQAQMKAEPVAVKATQNLKSVPQPEPAASPPSPSGWGNFSDSESHSNVGDDSFDLPAAAVVSQRALPSTTSSRSVSAAPSARAGTPTQKAAKLPSPTPAPPAVLKEKCTISQRSVNLVNLAESTMSSVISLLQGEHRADATADDAEALAGIIFKIFELHRALMPVAHGEVLQDVPALAMQFFNDCEYLARELSRLITSKGEAITSAWLSHDADAAKRWKTKELVKLEEEAALTRALGQRWFEAQMTAQTKILLDTMMEADGFARVFDEHRFARCERCIKQVVQTLNQLAKAWQPVLVPSRFHAALGRLVDLVFQKVLHDVLDLEDIGETESNKLASLIKTLGSLESLFAPADGGVEGGEQTGSAAPLWVASWFKTSYLIEILTGSLVDIEFLAFEAGALVDYSRKELTGLVKALFADTVNRGKLLRRIEGAGADVLAH